MKHISHLDGKNFSTKQFDAFQFARQHGQMISLSRKSNKSHQVGTLPGQSPIAVCSTIFPKVW